MLEEQIIEFFRNNPYPDLNTTSKAAEEIGITPEIFHNKMCELISCIVCGGNSAGVDIATIDSKELELGTFIEYEHMDKSSQFAPILSTKIATDHLVTTPTYYSQPDTAAQDIAEELQKMNGEESPEEEAPDTEVQDNQPSQGNPVGASIEDSRTHSQYESLRSFVRGSL